MQLLTEYEWTFVRIATLLFLFIGGFTRALYLGEVPNTYSILVSTALFMVWLTMTKILTNFIQEDTVATESISFTHILFFYVAIPLILVALIMMTGFFRE